MNIIALCVNFPPSFVVFHASILDFGFPPTLAIAHNKYKHLFQFLSKIQQIQMATVVDDLRGCVGMDSGFHPSSNHDETKKSLFTASARNVPVIDHVLRHHPASEIGCGPAVEQDSCSSVLCDLSSLRCVIDDLNQRCRVATGGRPGAGLEDPMGR